LTRLKIAADWFIYCYTSTESS